jgi:hypothetical protein
MTMMISMISTTMKPGNFAPNVTAQENVSIAPVLEIAPAEARLRTVASATEKMFVLLATVVASVTTVAVKGKLRLTNGLRLL